MKESNLNPQQGTSDLTTIKSIYLPQIKEIIENLESATSSNAFVLEKKRAIELSKQLAEYLKEGNFDPSKLGEEDINNNSENFQIYKIWGMLNELGADGFKQGKSLQPFKDSFNKLIEN